MQAEHFRQYVMYKAFDFLSEGAYRKLVVRSKECGEEWALQLYSYVQQVNNTLKRVHGNVASLHEYGKQRLQVVCSEIIASVPPPVRRKVGWHTCMITGVKSDDCIDLTRVGKSEGTIIISSRFAHFALMLWVVAKIDHVCKLLAKHWFQEKTAQYKAHTTVQQMCSDFARERDADFSTLHQVFQYAYSHSMNSIDTYKTRLDFESAPVLLASGLGHAVAQAVAQAVGQAAAQATVASEQAPASDAALDSSGGAGRTGAFPREGSKRALAGSTVRSKRPKTAQARDSSKPQS